MQCQALHKNFGSLIMSLSPMYLQKLAEAREQGHQEGRQEGRQEARQEVMRSAIQNLIKYKFGSVDDELKTIIESLLVLEPEQFIPLLSQLSRKDLLDKFSQPQSNE